MLQNHFLFTFIRCYNELIKKQIKNLVLPERTRSSVVIYWFDLQHMNIFLVFDA